MTVPGQVKELTRARCIELLQTTTVGRLAFPGKDHIEIMPVNFIFRDDAVIFRTATDNRLAALAPGVDGVAFEVDHHNDLGQSGWSVVLWGRIQAVEDESELAELRSQTRPRPWAAGDRPLFLRLDPIEITGRAVRRTAR